MELILFRSLRWLLILLLFGNVFGMTPNVPAEEKTPSTATSNQPSLHEIEEEPITRKPGTATDTPSTSGTVVETTEQLIKGIEAPFKKTYEPFIMFQNGEKVVPFQRSYLNLNQSKGIYRYYCPPEKIQDLQTNQTLCQHRQCLFLLKQTEEYDSMIICKMEIVPYTRPLSEDCGSYGTYRIGISVVLVLEETKPLPTEKPDDPDTNRNVVQTVSDKLYQSFYSGISFLSQLISEETGDLEQPLLNSEQSDVPGEQSASKSETDAPPSTTEAKEGVLPTNPISRKSDELKKSKNKEPEITEESTSNQYSYKAPQESQTLGEPIEQKKSLQPGTEKLSDPSTSDSQADASSPTTRIFHSNVPAKHTIVAQQLIPLTHQSSELWQKSTLFNINTAPLYLEFAALWNKIDELIDRATREFNSEILVYTGVLDLKNVAKTEELETFILMRTSIPLLVDANRQIISHTVPSVWYRIIGRPDSEESLIIILINDYKKTRSSYGIKQCSSLQADKAWAKVFNVMEFLTYPNILLCEYQKKIFSSKREDGIYPKEMLIDPTDLVLKLLF